MPSPIDPSAIPGQGLEPDLIASHARTVGTIAGSVRDNGSSAQTSWRGMSGVYSAPESGTLLGLMHPVSTQATTAGDNLDTVSAALIQFAEDVRPIKAELDSLRAQAQAFIDTTVAHGVRVRELNPAWVSATQYSGSWNAYGAVSPTGTPTGDVPQYRYVTKEWHEDQGAVDRNNELIAAVNAQQVLLWEAERACANKIRALYGAAALHSFRSENDPNGYGLDEIPEGTEMPWGAPVERTEGCGEATFNFVVKDFLWEGIAVGGVWGTIQGLGTLVLGYDPATGDWFSGDAYGAAWGGLGMLAAGLVIASTPPLNIIKGIDDTIEAFGGDGFLPDPIDDFAESADDALLNTGKALIAWDKWQDDPGTALGESVFNVATIVIPAGAAITGVKTAGTAASVLSKMARVVDLIDPGAWAVNGSLRLASTGLGSLDNLIGGLDLAGRLDVPHIEVYAATDAAHAMDLLDDFGIDANTVTSRVDEGVPLLEFPGGRVELPAGSFDGAGRIHGADGGTDAAVPAPVREPELVAAGGVRGETGPGAVDSIVDDAPTRTETTGSGESTVVHDPETDSSGGGTPPGGTAGDAPAGGDDAPSSGDGGHPGGDDAPTHPVVDPLDHLGPDVIDRTLPGGDLVPESYQPFGDLTQDEFIAAHWDPAKVHEWDGSTGGWIYPPDEGFDLSPGSPAPQAIDPPTGYRFDRFGGQSGEYVSPEGASFPSRALPPDSLDKPYHVYEVVRPFDSVSGRPVAGRIAEAFEQPGGGIQLKLPQTVQWLLDNGYIKEVQP